MRYAEGTGIASATAGWTSTPTSGCGSPSTTRSPNPRPARHRDREALRQTDGHRMGQDGLDGRLYILQARPETVVSRRGEAGRSLSRFEIDRAAADATDVLVEGRSIGQRIGAGPVRVLRSIRRWTGSGPGCAGRRDHRPGLGTGDETRRRDHHRTRRPNLSRRDHRPRTGRTRDRRNRRRDNRTRRRPGGHGLVRRRRYRFACTGGWCSSRSI